MSDKIKLIVGLGNPGPQYDLTRHNAGAWFIKTIAEQESIQLKNENKFFGHFQKLNLHIHECFLLIPTTFMNHSGRSVSAVCNYYDITPEEVLVAHDELDLPVGKLKLKKDGGHGGHNGLRDIIKAFGTNDFYRLRLGIGHPGHKDKVHDYVLSHPSKHDKTLIDDAICRATRTLEEIVSGNIAKAMQTLHTTE